MKKIFPLFLFAISVQGISRLTVQNVAIRIECNNDLLNKIITDINWKAFADMTGE